MRSQRLRPAVLSRDADELSLSGPALVELLRAVLGRGVPCRFRARGFSMFPFIRDGDIITVSPLQGATLRRGDVVAFVAPGRDKLVIHRVVGNSGDSYLVKGDAASEVDGLVQRENILGRVTRVERDGKDILLGLGPERFLIAVLTRRRILFPLLLPVWRLVRSIVRRLAT